MHVLRFSQHFQSKNSRTHRHIYLFIYLRMQAHDGDIQIQKTEKKNARDLTRTHAHRRKKNREIQSPTFRKDVEPDRTSANATVSLPSLRSHPSHPLPLFFLHRPSPRQKISLYVRTFCCDNGETSRFFHRRRIHLFRNWLICPSHF